MTLFHITKQSQEIPIHKLNVSFRATKILIRSRAKKVKPRQQKALYQLAKEVKIIQRQTAIKIVGHC